MSTVKVNAAQIGQSITTTNNFTMYQPATPDGTVRLGNGNAGSVTDLVVLNSSGNLGLGVTPSAWATSRKVLQVGGSAALWSNASGAGFAFFSNNAYNDGAWKYINTSAASYYTQTTDSSHVWYQASSGTAGNPITFTQAMTLDASGKLLVGTTTGSSGASVQASFVNSNGGGIQFGYPTTGGGALVGNASGGIQFYGYAGAQGSEGFAERMRIDSSGNVGIGTSTIGAKLTVSGSSGAQLLIGPYGSRTYSFNTRANGGYADAWCDVVSNSSVAGYTWQNQSGSLLTLTLNGTAVLLGGNTTSNGVGITFPATQSASSDANTLDDYEEGTWTPTLSAASGSVSSYGSRTGLYVKVGQLVYIEAYVALTNKGTISGQVTLTNLPFLSNSTSGTYNVINARMNSMNSLPSPSTGVGYGQIAPSDATAYLQVGTASGISSLDSSFVSNVTDIVFTGVYRANV